jgi:hypothetical protein
MSEEKQKSSRLFIFWLFGTVMIVFAAITAYIVLFTGGTMWGAIRAGFPIWGITALASIIVYAVYHFYSTRDN